MFFFFISLCSYLPSAHFLLDCCWITAAPSVRLCSHLGQRSANQMAHTVIVNDPCFLLGAAHSVCQYEVLVLLCGPASVCAACKNFLIVPLFFAVCCVEFCLNRAGRRSVWIFSVNDFTGVSCGVKLRLQTAVYFGNKPQSLSGILHAEVESVFCGQCSEAVLRGLLCCSALFSA